MIEEMTCTEVRFEKGGMDLSVAFRKPTKISEAVKQICKNYDLDESKIEYTWT